MTTDIYSSKAASHEQVGSIKVRIGLQILCVSSGHQPLHRMSSEDSAREAGQTTTLEVNAELSVLTESAGTSFDVPLAAAASTLFAPSAKPDAVERESDAFLSAGAIGLRGEPAAIGGSNRSDGFRCSSRVFLGLAVAVVLVCVACGAYLLGRREGLNSAAVPMMTAVYVADDPRARAVDMMQAAGQEVPLLLSPSQTPSLTPSAQPSPSSSPTLPPSASPSLAASPAPGPSMLTLTCQDVGDGSACNEPLPPDEALQPLRLPGWGTSLCRKPEYPQSFDFAGRARITSHPFWSCDNAWEIADHHLVSESSSPHECPLDPSTVRCGDTVFFESSYDRLASWLQNEHRGIRWPYIMLSCGFDVPPPSREAVVELQQQPADNPKLWAWYGQNIGVLGPLPRAHSMPAGLAPGGWRAGDRDRIFNTYFADPDEAKAALRAKLVTFLGGTWELDHTMQDTVFASFTVSLHPAERQPAADAAARLGSGERRIDFQDYPAALKRALFVLSPGGAGLDVHRVTEAVVAGALPILREHYWPVGYYDGWPRVLVGRWEDITHDWLRNAAEIALAMLDAGQFDFRRAYGAFQLARIRREQRRAREWCAARGDAVSAALLHNASQPTA